MSTPQNTHRFTPLMIAIAVVIGIIMGNFYANHFSGRRLSIINTSSNKLNDLLHLVDDQYVDTVNISELVENSLPKILHELDPHSTYTKASDVELEMQNLQGHFSGIGIQYYIYKDTVNVVKIIPGGPADGSGLKPGDRIIKVDGKAFTGKDITNDIAMKTLKGPKDSHVTLTVYTPYGPKGKKNVHKIQLTRGNVPVKTINAVYMLDETTGYIRVTSFGSTTYSEFLSALAQLNSEGFERLIIDLRGNLGGYMEPAVQMANEFLPKNRLIVYTEGRRSPREDHKSDGRGTYQHMPLYVLVDEYSASASEIFSGAMQDNDRAQIIGRRTFGKGLVQVPIEFRDGSLLRLTRARYYTPSGRCVQKPYQLGDPRDEYEKDIVNREMSGELFSADSIKTNGKIYHTRNGRTVYGGGGIIPDEFVPLDTLGYTAYFRDISLNGTLYEFAHHYADTHRAKISDDSRLASTLEKSHLPEMLATYADKNGVRRRPAQLSRSYSLIRSMLIRNIINDISGEEDAIKYANEQDPVVIRTRQIIAADQKKK